MAGVQERGPRCQGSHGAQLEALGRRGPLTPFSEVGVVQGNWKNSGEYLQRVKAEADTEAFEQHVQARTVKGEEVWPLQRPATFFDMLMVDLKVDYKAST